MEELKEVTPQIGYFIKRQCTPSWHIKETVIDFIDLTFVVQGRATYTIDGKIYELEQGDLLCIPKASSRSAICDPVDPMVSLTANFQCTNFQGEDIALPFPIVSKIGIHDDILALYDELNMAWLQKSPGYSMLVQGIFLMILYRYFRMLFYKESNRRIDSRIQKTIQFIHDNYARSIEIIDLAHLVDLNPVYFGTLFKKSTGVSVKRYINQVRINNAENMIASGEFLIGEAAYKCGFQDIFYFSKVFKQLKGYPPSKVPGTTRILSNQNIDEICLRS